MPSSTSPQGWGKPCPTWPSSQTGAGGGPGPLLSNDLTGLFPGCRPPASPWPGGGLADYFQTPYPTFPPLAAPRQALAGEVVSFEVGWAGRTYQAQVEPFRDLSGQIIGCIGVALDIPARKA